MKKFEEALKDKAHNSKIKNARKTIPSSGKHMNGGKSAFEKTGDESKLLLNLYDNKNYDSIPAYKLLRTAGLQQYTRGFIVRGYGINLGKLALISSSQKQKMYQDLKILPGHTVKLDKLIDLLAKNSYTDQCELQLAYDKSASQVSRRSIIPAKAQTKGTLQDLQYEKQLERLINQYTPIDSKKKSIIHSKLSQKSTTSSARFRDKYTKTNYKTNANKNTDFSKKQSQSSKTTIKKTGTTFTSSNQIAQKQKLGKLLQNITAGSKIDSKRVMEIDLQIDKVKSLYRSFEGALMSSTIVNLDLEELIFAFAGYVFAKVVPASDLNTGKQANIGIKNQLPTYSLQADVDISTQNIENIEDEVGEILRESYMHPLYRQQPVGQEIVADQAESEGENEECEGTCENEFSIDNRIGQSSFLGGESYDFGINQPLKIFDEPQPGSIDYMKPTIDSIFNFIKNVVLSAKMERQIPIMAANYIQAFLCKSKVPLTSLNYKRLLVSSLLLASKIWDDESFESPSFSRTFPEFTTVLLNQMEKQILKQLDYKLKLNKTEYARTFFELRKYRKANFKSYQNRKLNLNKIRQLQEGVKKDYKTQFISKRPSF